MVGILGLHWARRLRDVLRLPLLRCDDGRRVLGGRAKWELGPAGRGRRDAVRRRALRAHVGWPVGLDSSGGWDRRRDAEHRWRDGHESEIADMSTNYLVPVAVLRSLGLSSGYHALTLPDDPNPFLVLETAPVKELALEEE